MGKATLEELKDLARILGVDLSEDENVEWAMAEDSADYHGLIL